jgi:hypothetical protein
VHLGDAPIFPQWALFGTWYSAHKASSRADKQKLPGKHAVNTIGLAKTLVTIDQGSFDIVGLLGDHGKQY